MKQKTLLPIRVMIAAAFLTALSIVLTRFLSVITIGGAPVRVGLGVIPIIVAGLYLGPIAGAMTGLLADLIGVLINPMGTFHPGFTLDSVLRGLIPGLLVLLFSRLPLYKTKKWGNYVVIVLAWLAVTVCVSIFMTPIWLSGFSGAPYWLTLWGRLPIVLMIGVAHLVLLLLLAPVLELSIGKLKERVEP